MNMRFFLLGFTMAFAPSAAAAAAPPKELCDVLRRFVESVQPKQQQEFVFHTSWGANFKDQEKPALAANRCAHAGYEPAKAVCDYLIAHAWIEFPGIDFLDSISCLSPQTKFDPDLRIEHGAFRFRYGTPDRGAWIDVSLEEDPSLGGKAFKLSARGY